ncbi:MAG: AAA family ATPase [Planctomycetota bacterium]|jgi:MoxR-like ATPase
MDNESSAWPPEAPVPTPAHTAAPASTAPSTLEQTLQSAQRLQEVLRQVVVGQDPVLEQMLICLLCSGHALLEGVPGTAKTLAVRALAAALGCTSKRIQFTPDLMPSDIVGTNVFNLSNNQFELHRGPVFTDLLLADEINRAPAKTQSALLEGMSERHATIDGVRHHLSPIFSVFATQNPIEYEGTYPLPEAQQDRFLMKIKIDYPDEAMERTILDAVHRGEPLDQKALSEVPSVLSIEALTDIQATLSQVGVEPGILQYGLSIVRATRTHESILVGAGPRGSIALLKSSKARAVLKGRDFVTPDDVVAMVAPVLGHRLTLTADAEIQGASVEEVLQSILDSIEVPR